VSGAWSERLAGFLPDTSLLIAAFTAWHEHHPIAAEALDALTRERGPLVLAAPVLLETYAVLTRFPPPHRLSPDSAVQLVRANLAGRRTVALDGRGYWRFVERAAAGGVAGGRIYDALIVACATRAGVDRLVTLNRAHFVPFVPPGMTVDCPI